MTAQMRTRAARTQARKAASLTGSQGISSSRRKKRVRLRTSPPASYLDHLAAHGGGRVVGRQSIRVGVAHRAGPGGSWEARLSRAAFPLYTSHAPSLTWALSSATRFQEPRLLASHRPSDVCRDGIRGVVPPGVASLRSLGGRAGRQVIATTGAGRPRLARARRARGLAAPPRHGRAAGDHARRRDLAGQPARGEREGAVRARPVGPGRDGRHHGPGVRRRAQPAPRRACASRSAPLSPCTAASCSRAGPGAGSLERTTKRRVLVVGTTAMAEIMAAVRRERVAPFEIVGAAERGRGRPGAIARSRSPTPRTSRSSSRRSGRTSSCSPTTSRARSRIERLLDMTDRRFRVAGLTSFYEHAFGCVPLEQITSMWFLSLLHLRQRSGPPAGQAVVRHRRRRRGPAGDGAAAAADRAAGQAHARTADLPADARQRGRPALHDVQVPLDAA